MFSRVHLVVYLFTGIVFNCIPTFPLTCPYKVMIVYCGINNLCYYSSFNLFNFVSYYFHNYSGIIYTWLCVIASVIYQLKDIGLHNQVQLSNEQNSAHLRKHIHLHENDDKKEYLPPEKFIPMVMFVIINIRVKL